MIVDVAAVPSGVQHTFRGVPEILHGRIGPFHAGRAHHEDLLGIQRSQPAGIAVVGAPAVQTRLVAAAFRKTVEPDLIDDPLVHILNDPGALVGVKIHVVEGEARVKRWLDAFLAHVVIHLRRETVSADKARPGRKHDVRHEGDFHHAMRCFEPPVGLVFGHVVAQWPAESGVQPPPPRDLGHVRHPGIVGDHGHLEVKVSD